MITDLEARANALVEQFHPYCAWVSIISVKPGHWQFKVKRKVSKPPSTLFGDGDTKHYPFDEWCARQGDIRWTSGGRGAFWIGNLSDGTKITIRVEA